MTFASGLCYTRCIERKTVVQDWSQAKMKCPNLKCTNAKMSWGYGSSDKAPIYQLSGWVQRLSESKKKKKRRIPVTPAGRWLGLSEDRESIHKVRGVLKAWAAYLWATQTGLRTIYLGKLYCRAVELGGKEKKSPLSRIHFSDCETPQSS
jgi:hypothetical protein